MWNNPKKTTRATPGIGQQRIIRNPRTIRSNLMNDDDEMFPSVLLPSTERVPKVPLGFTPYSTVGTRLQNPERPYLGSSPRLGKLPTNEHPNKKENPNTWKKEGKKPEYEKKEINKDYKTHQELSEANQIIPETDLKMLRRLCANLVTSAQNISIKYSKHKPAIYFEYSDGDERKCIHFRDVIRGNSDKKIPVEAALIFRVFDRLYEQVPEEYWLVGRFGLVQAEEKKLNKFKNRDIVKDANNFKLYYSKGKKPGYLSFNLFQYKLFYVEYTNKYIEEKKGEYPKEYSIYLKFVNSINNGDVPVEETIEHADEADSDTEATTNVVQNKGQSDSEALMKRIKEILSKDVSNFEKLMEAKNDKCEELSRNGSPQKIEQLEQLSEEVSEMDTCLEYFKGVKREVQLRLQRVMLYQETGQLRMLLKKLILAEKYMDSRLPILARKTEIFRMLDKQNLIILEGQTGSGKSTQLPQLLCEYYKVFENSKSLPVLITQPRKLATRSLAERVASELEEEVHGFVEYQASSNNRQLNKNAKIIFKLDRLVLDQMTADPLLSNYCCLVIDEAHERTISIDVILGRVKHILSNRKDFKVIVTSASLDTGLFRDYFQKQILKVEGRMYPVTEIFRPLEFIQDTKEKIERILIQEVLEAGLERTKEQYKGHVLVFCSGVDEINSLVMSFQKKLNSKNFKILGLHGRMNPEEQKEVFQESKRTKIIFSTRIAETSITINGVKVVIDPGIDREMVFDQASRISSMQIKTISESSAKQRAGRAGRTNTGFCFRLYSEEDKRKMRSNKTPQIQNMALDTVVLRLKSLKIKDVVSFDYLSPPDPKGLKVSVETMKIMGCLDNREEITEIGKLLIKIPIEPFLSRAIVESMFFQIALKDDFNAKDYKMKKEDLDKLFLQDLQEQTVRVLSMLVNSSSLFNVKQTERQEAQKNKMTGHEKMNGDFNLFLAVFSQFLEYYEAKKNEQLRFWANKNYLSLKTLHQARQLHHQISTILKGFNFRQREFIAEIANARRILKLLQSPEEALIACLLPSFVTNLCLYSQKSEIGYTHIYQQIPIHLYGTTLLSLQGRNPKWILCYDLYTNQNSLTYCKAAQEIDFSFLKAVVKEDIKAYYKLEEAQKQNPFYGHIRHELPSLIYMDILSDYRKRNTNPELDFLNKFNIFFNEAQNSIDVYYLAKKFKESAQTNRWAMLGATATQLQQGHYRQSNDPQQIISDYIKECKAKYHKAFTHEYIGQISIVIDEGFEVKEIVFSKSVFNFKVTAKGETADLVYYLCSPLGKVTRYQEKQIYLIQGETKREQFKRKIQVLRQFYKYERISSDVKYIEEIMDKRHKIPKAKLLLTFYAGTANNRNIFLNYKKHDSPLLQMAYIESILECFSNQKLKFNELKIHQTIASKNMSGINCHFITPTDEYQLYGKLLKIYQEKKLGYTFQMPCSIIKFRQPQAPYCFNTDHEWETQIRKLMRKIGGDNQKLTIRVWGTFKRGNVDEVERKKHIRVNMHAQIESFSLTLMQKFHAEYNGKKGVLGTEKVHIAFQFNQTIAAPSFQVFSALYSDYIQIASFEKIKNEKIFIEASDPKHMKNVWRVFITIRGESRQDFIKPSLNISNLFKPTQMRIEPKFSYKFDWASRNRSGNILSELEAKHNFRVHFVFEKRSNILKIYANEQICSLVQKQIAERLEQIEVLSQAVSYRGKSLLQVERIIKQFQNKLQQNKTLQYEVLYGKREVMLTGDIDTLIDVKNQISALSNTEKLQCSVCCGLQQAPYKLLNCGHSFCMLCLVSSVKESDNRISCPQGCGEKVSVYDIRRILSEDEFNQICDRQVNKYIEKDSRFHGCFTPDCEQIFLMEQSKQENSFQCELCGKWYCLECKTSHHDGLCGGKLANFEKLGIKQCPKCKTGIEKNDGCNHMTCTNCKSHICWVCLKLFETAKQCYDHLAKDCGGIFPAGMRG